MEKTAKVAYIETKEGTVKVRLGDYVEFVRTCGEDLIGVKAKIVEINSKLKVESPNGRLITVMFSEIEKGFARICKVGWKQYEERR